MSAHGDLYSFHFSGWQEEIQKLRSEREESIEEQCFVASPPNHKFHANKHISIQIKNELPT